MKHILMQTVGTTLSCHHAELVQMSYSLNSFRGGYLGDDTGDYYRGYRRILGVLSIAQMEATKCPDQLLRIGTRASVMV